MASQYSIIASDLTPTLVPGDDYTNLLIKPSDGTTELTIGNLVEAAENEFNAHIGGMFATAANIAIAKPMVLFVVVYRLHWRKAANSDYKIPEQATADWKAAIEWAKTSGRELYGKEGLADPLRTPPIEYDAPDEAFGLTQLDNL